MKPLDLAAKRADFHRYAATAVRSRWDYFSADHRLEEILNDRYFRTVLHELSPGDRIQIIDRDENEAEVKVQYTDAERNLVGIAVVSEIAFKPVEGKPQIRIAGGRGRGTRYQIVDGEGAVLEDNIAGKRNAERRLEDHLEEEAA